MGRKISVVIIFVLVLKMFQHDLYSQTVNSNIPDVEVRQRLVFIESALEEGQTCANVWYWSWFGICVSTASIQLAIYFAAEEINPNEPEHLRQDMMTGVITSAIGIVGLSLDPMVPGYAIRRFRNMPSGSVEERLLKLEQAEYWMRRSAIREEDGRSWFAHTVNFVLNLAAGLTIWLAFDRTIIDGLLTFLPGMFIGELQILTQPTRAIDDWERYEERFMNRNSYNVIKRDQLDWFIAPYPGGFITGIHF